MKEELRPLKPMPGNTDEDSGLGNMRNHYISTYGRIPSTRWLSRLDPAKVGPFVKGLQLIVVDRSSSNTRRLYRKEDVWMVVDGIGKKSRWAGVSMYYEMDCPVALELIKAFKEMKLVFPPPVEKPVMHFLTTSMVGTFQLRAVELEVPEIDIALNYGSEFASVDVRVKQAVESKKPGLFLFHGPPGTGKTFYIRHLMSKFLSREIIYVPVHVARAIAEPSFMGFMLERQEPLLVIEDAEMVITGRGEGNGAVANLLNITDGILGEAMKCQVVATFNIERTAVDKALLRKGRLLAEYEFGPLKKDEANALLTHLQKEPVAEDAMTLADIYNADIPRVVRAEKTMGFAVA